MKFQTIGILGGGQLGRMLVYAAQRMGMHTAILDPDPDAPAGQIADRHVVGDFRDPAKVLELAQGCDVVTVEIEHVNVEALENLERSGIAVQPSAKTIRLIQDKFAQKQHFAEYDIQMPFFRDTPDLVTARTAATEFGYPLLLKSKRLAYDGRGNTVVRSADELDSAFSSMTKSGAQQLYIEAFVPFEKELAVMVARGLDGTIAAYPVVETIQRDNICHAVIAPAQIPATARDAARDLAMRTVAALDGAGIYGVELFMLPDGQVLLNEIAPRPHNSGHYTIEACVTSQFEQHLRAVTGLPLGDTLLKVGAAAMVNVLGQDSLETTMQPIETALTLDGATIHWYGKHESRPKRKMGHITLTSDSISALNTSLSALTDVSISPSPVVGIIMGSDSDLPVMKQAAVTLREFGVPFELTIVSAHRTPDRMFKYAQSAHSRGLKAIIAGAGGAAHLPGMVAALTPLPVIGVPMRTEALGGQDSLLSIVQMPRGVPVATVAINSATNAALLAVRILAVHDPALYRRMVDYQQTMEVTVMEKVEGLAKNGWE